MADAVGEPAEPRRGQDAAEGRGGHDEPETKVTRDASTICPTKTVMIGSMDMLASIRSIPVTSMATIGRLSGICD